MRGRDYSKLASLQNSVNFPGLWRLLNVGLRHTASMRILPFHSFDRNHRGWARRDFQTPVLGSTLIDRTVLATDQDEITYTHIYIYLLKISGILSCCGLIMSILAMTPGRCSFVPWEAIHFEGARGQPIACHPSYPAAHS